VTDTNLTEIIAIIDRSGSMESLRAETIGGYNNFIDEQKKGPGKAIVTLVQFDDQYQVDYEGTDVNDVKPLDESTYQPRGMTALLDAVGKTIVTVGERLAKLDEDKRPGQIIFLIITDGHENSSKEYAAAKLKEMVKHQEEKYNWTFVFLGGGDIESQRDQGMSFGVAASNAYGYTPDAKAMNNVYSSVSKGVSRRRFAAAAGEVVCSTQSLLTEDEKDQLVTKE
jgi:uncharacterized protein YegL